MKGIILAGGSGTRLYPMTKVISKHIIPLYDKPMIYYPLSVLMLAGIRDIMIISTPRDLYIFKNLFGDGTKIGLNIKYAVQIEQRGTAEAFIIAEDFIGSDNTALVLGDNIFYGYGFSERLKDFTNIKEGAMIFGYHVSNPSDFGVIEFDKDLNVVSIEEKPNHPKSNYAVPGLYFYDNNVIGMAKALKPSERSELEITDINNAYLKKGRLKAEILGRGMAWLDTGTPSGLLNAANFVETVQKRQGLYIACIEEIAYRKGFINKSQLKEIAEAMIMTDYGKYLLNLTAT